MPTTEKEFSIDELCSLTGLPKRTVRYYIQIGLVDRPEGETRAARYTQKHLEQLLAIRRWTQEGLSLERIRELLSGTTQTPPGRPDRSGTVEIWSRFILAEGVEVGIDPARAGLSPEQTRHFFAAVMTAFRQIKPEDPSA